MLKVEVTETVAGDPDVVRLALLLRSELAARYRADVVGPPPAPGSPAVVARAGGEAVGCAVLHLLDDDEAELRSMFIVAGHRGAGLGRRLLAAVEDAARREGVRTVRLVTGALQPEAVALYERTGYRPTECPDSLHPDTLCFSKSLPPAP